MNSPAAGSNLAGLAPGASGVVVAIGLDPRESDWLRAVGLFEGVRVTLLRRAPLGGPLHVRTSSGAELAVDRRLAGAVAIGGGAGGGA